MHARHRLVLGVRAVGAGRSRRSLVETDRAARTPPQRQHGFADRHEPEFGQQALEARHGPPEPTIVSRARQPGDMNAGLVGIDLPWMDIERARHVPALALPQCRAYHTVRQKPEVAAARRGEPHAAPAQRRRGNLREPAGGTLDKIWIRPPRWISVSGTPDWKQARVVAVPFLEQDIEGPLPTRHDRETRRTKSHDRDAGDVLELPLRAAHGAAELRRSQLRHPRVIPAVGRNLMPRTGNRSNQVPVALGDPADDKARGARVMPREQRQEPLHLRCYAGWVTVPVAARDIRLQGRNLKVFLNIDGEVMGRHDGQTCNRHARMYERLAASRPRSFVVRQQQPSRWRCDTSSTDTTFASGPDGTGYATGERGDNHDIQPPAGALRHPRGCVRPDGNRGSVPPRYPAVASHSPRRDPYHQRHFPRAVGQDSALARLDPHIQGRARLDPGVALPPGLP